VTTDTPVSDTQPAAPGGAGAPRRGFLDRYFQLSERGTTPRIEALGGLSTFLTMSYILFVNPAILSAAGVPFKGVAVATALAAAICTLAMGLIANLPFGLASGLGLNAVVAFDLILGHKLPWAVGMACVVIEGLIILLLVAVGLRQAVMRAIPESLKYAIAVGIGLFIAFIGLRQGGIVVNNPATGVGLGDLTSGPPLIALAGILVAAGLVARNVRGAILFGILTSTALGLIFGVLDGPTGVAEWPGKGSFSTIGDALAWNNLSSALTWALVPIIFALIMTEFFDTIGTSTGLAAQAGLLDEKGEIPRMGRMLAVDAVSASAGGAMGASSVTTYIESSAGIAEGARTGLASVFTAVLFALAIFFVPIIALVGQQVPYVEKSFISPAIAPALVIAGYLMTRLVQRIDWTQNETALPSFLIVAGIPLTFSIAAGIGLGVIAYAFVMTVKGKARQVHPLMWALVPLFVAFFADKWLSAHVF
jgi:AGZA family xanthine/uracil permease-like MFS transporter